MYRLLLFLAFFLGASHLSHSVTIKTKSAEIVVRIVPTEASICLESRSLPLEIYITNVTSKNITISKEWVLKMSSFDVAYDQEQKNTRIATLSSRGDAFPGVRLSHTWGKLSPGASNRYVTSIELSNRKFFTGPSFYKVMVQCVFYLRDSSGKIREIVIDSNEVLFELASCSAQ
jgi:hypothetical protein